MWPDRRLCDLFEIEHPILQAPMAGASTPAMAQAVSNAGGLGALACAKITAERIEADVATFRAGSNRPVNLNFFATPASDPPTREDVARVAQYLHPLAARIGVTLPVSAPAQPAGYGPDRHATVLALAPSVVSFHFGLGTPTQRADLKAAGIKYISTATNRAEARDLAEAGCAAIIAQGYEAGGHRGTHGASRAPDGIGTLALVPQIVDAVDVPVIAAGGIVDGRGIAAALALGAAGVQIGSAFLLSDEAATEPARRAAIAASDGTETMMIAGVSGRPARGRRSDLAQILAPHDGNFLPFGAQYALANPLIDAADDDTASFQLYGQAAGAARAEPAEAILRRLVGETRAALSRLT